MRVIGDLDGLGVIETATEQTSQPTTISLAAATTAMEGTLRLAMKREKRLRERVDKFRPQGN